MTEKLTLTLHINSDRREIKVDAERTLLQVLREDLGLTGAKCGCNYGVCGSCTVLVDGLPARACLALIGTMTDREITTVEGLERDGVLLPVQQAFIDHQALQCGFCTPGMILSAKALLDSDPNPTAEDIRHWLGGNICRCTGYVKIIDAVLSVSKGS